MAEAETTLAGVLAEHEPWAGGWHCLCQVEHGADDPTEPLPVSHVDHLAEVVLDHLAAVASEAAVVEAVAEAVYATGQGYGQPDFEPEDAATLASAALAAFLRAFHCREDRR